MKASQDRREIINTRSSWCSVCCFSSDFNWIRTVSTKFWENHKRKFSQKSFQQKSLRYTQMDTH